MASKPFRALSTSACEAPIMIIFLNPTIHATNPDMQQKAKDAVQLLFDENPSLAERRANTVVIMKASVIPFRLPSRDYQLIYVGGICITALETMTVKALIGQSSARTAKKSRQKDMHTLPPHQLY